MLSLIATDTLRTLTRAAVKAAGARLRQLGARSTYQAWPVRAEVCERCPLRVIKCGKSYCGNPLVSQLNRDPVQHGCGCPTRAKAKDPAEHCPIDSRCQPAVRTNDRCTCKWCAIAA